MKFTLALLALATAAWAQNSTNATDSSTYLSGLLAAFAQNNLTSLQALASAQASILPLIEEGNHTVFAPSNIAFGATNTTNNPTMLTDLLQYHILYGAYGPDTFTRNHTILRSAFNTSSSVDTVSLPGEQGQVVVVVGNGTNATLPTVRQVSANVTAKTNFVYENLEVYVIDEFLTIPTSINSTAAAAGLTSFAGLLSTYAPTFLTALQAVRGVTVFIPEDSAIISAAGSLGALNMSLIDNVLDNHYINGSVYYSSQLYKNRSAISASGEPLSLFYNTSGHYVQSGAVTARIIHSDILIDNGVVHVIDNVLANTLNDTTAAVAAASSASAAGATRTQVATGAVGGVPNSSGAAATATSTTKSPADKLQVAGGLLALVAGVAALL